VVDDNLQGAQVLIARIKKWVTGEYTLASPQTANVKVTAAIGVASWQPGDTVADVFRKADAVMYAEKALMKTSVG